MESGAKSNQHGTQSNLSVGMTHMNTDEAKEVAINEIALSIMN